MLRVYFQMSYSSHGKRVVMSGSPPTRKHEGVSFPDQSHLEFKECDVPNTLFQDEL